MTIAEIAHRLHGKRCGQGYSGLCPCHEDREPSLSLREGKDGKPLVKCFAGCDPLDIIRKLREMGWWPAHDTKRVVVAEYGYTDASGKLLYQVCRTEPKGFFQRQPDGHGGWVNRGPRDEDKVLYCLREVIEAPIVFLPEGERDVQTLRDFGFTATTNCGGANAPWLPQYTEALRGREVILIPDNDDAGWKRAQRITEALIDAVDPLIVVELPQEIKDISDWFLDHSETELIAKVEHGRSSEDLKKHEEAGDA